LRLETLRFGIRVTLVEPGDFRTEMPTRRRLAAASQSHDAYASEFSRFKVKQDEDESNAAEPHAVALLVERLCRHPRPKMRYSVGMLSQRIVVPLKRFLPQRSYEWLLCRVIGL
jgi:NAD(P)-dependent dehydrogenase (short-subunit alcohol dehydrogenase family)